MVAIDSIAREERDVIKELKLRDKDVQIEENRIRNAKYNRVYKEMGKLPRYLKFENLKKGNNQRDQNFN